jgi:hypothetical protein
MTDRGGSQIWNIFRKMENVDKPLAGEIFKLFCPTAQHTRTVILDIMFCLTAQHMYSNFRHYVLSDCTAHTYSNLRHYVLSDCTAHMYSNLRHYVLSDCTAHTYSNFRHYVLSDCTAHTYSNLRHYVVVNSSSANMCSLTAGHLCRWVIQIKRWRYKELLPFVLGVLSKSSCKKQNVCICQWYTGTRSSHSFPCFG